MPGTETLLLATGAERRVSVLGPRPGRQTQHLRACGATPLEHQMPLDIPFDNAPRDRYHRDPVFRALVDMMTVALVRADITPHDLARAATLAATIYAERYHVPVSIVLMPDGSAAIETIADQLRAELLARLNTET